MRKLIIKRKKSVLYSWCIYFIVLNVDISDYKRMSKKDCKAIKKNLNPIGSGQTIEIEISESAGTAFIFMETDKIGNQIDIPAGYEDIICETQMKGIFTDNYYPIIKIVSKGKKFDEK